MGIRERINASLTDVRARGQRLVQLNLELLRAELKAKGQKYGAAIAMFVVAGLLALYALGFLLATIVVAIHVALPLWLSMLIVTVALFLVIAILLLAGRGSLRKAKSPAPERAIAEAKSSAETFKTGVRDTAQRVKPKPKPLTPAEQLAADAKAAEAKWPGAASPPHRRRRTSRRRRRRRPPRRRRLRLLHLKRRLRPRRRRRPRPKKRRTDGRARSQDSDP